MAEGLSKANITGLLADWAHRTPAAEARLMEAVYAELHTIARGYMRRERGKLTLQPTALVHEAYVRLVEQWHGGRWNGRAHFYGIAARLMRQILVDRARERRALKRAATRAPVSVSKLADPSGGKEIDMLALHEALTDLAAIDPRQAEIVELRYFGGLTEAEVARLKDLAPSTVRLEVASARYWLGLRMGGGS
jgi:RNA polymerase sigma factor (TIGR02999 family)